MKNYKANIGWDGGTATYFHTKGHFGPVVVEAPDAAGALIVFHSLLTDDAESNPDRYEGDVESIDVEEV